MVTERVQQSEHDTVLGRIRDAMASDLWEGRLSAVELAQQLLRDLPTEKTVERLVEVLARLAQDTKWEVRRAIVPALVDARRPGAKDIIERLTGDNNQWVRQAAERAKRKLLRITTPAEKADKRARFVFETIKDLEGRSPEKIYDAAMLVGERYYEELAGDTAHELNTYRAAMEGLLQELERRVGNRAGASPELDEMFARIHDRSRYLKTLINGLLEYSRDADLDFQRQPLRPMVCEALDLAREKASECLGDQEVEESLAIPVEIELEAARGRLVQALVNILSNAFESLVGKGDGARVRVFVTSDSFTSDGVTSDSVAPAGGDRLIVTITDTGCGMDPTQLVNATKRFRSLKKNQGGVGLGLPLALKIIEREHQGRLELESTPGVGTIVTIELPVQLSINREAP